jgi:hypothetical protein
MSEPKWVHVELPGHGTFWVGDAALRGEDSSPLAPEEHIRDGKLDYSACFDTDTYAHVYPDARGIMRFYRKIGEIADLKPIDRIAVIEANSLPGSAASSTPGSEPE